MSFEPKLRGKQLRRPPALLPPLDAGQPLAHVTNVHRLALSHNLLSTLPSRLIECKRLRYLNVRHNAMREIPEAVRPTHTRAEHHS